MSYTKQTWVTGDTITADKLNHIEDGVEDSSSSLSSYDLVIVSDIVSFNNLTVSLNNLTTSNVHVVHGDILDMEDKVDQGIPVSGLFILSGDWSSCPSAANTAAKKLYIPMVQFDGPYHRMYFATLVHYGNIEITGVSIIYDINTGAISNVRGYSTIL